MFTLFCKSAAFHEILVITEATITSCSMDRIFFLPFERAVPSCIPPNIFRDFRKNVLSINLEDKFLFKTITETSIKEETKYFKDWDLVNRDIFNKIGDFHPFAGVTVACTASKKEKWFQELRNPFAARSQKRDTETKKDYWFFEKRDIVRKLYLRKKS